jgi:hypothetical protein
VRPGSNAALRRLWLLGLLVTATVTRSHVTVTDGIFPSPPPLQRPPAPQPRPPVFRSAPPAACLRVTVLRVTVATSHGVPSHGGIRVTAATSITAGGFPGSAARRPGDVTGLAGAGPRAVTAVPGQQAQAGTAMRPGAASAARVLWSNDGQVMVK